ncbi:MAG: hypothetical protein M3044_20915 [Thermoproteota archaeon]|nr:hypothetical protein [Thermoproteota archaeon]
MKVECNNPPVGAVDLNHTMTKRDDMDVAKENLAVNPYQNNIFYLLPISWNFLEIWLSS